MKAGKTRQSVAAPVVIRSFTAPSIHQFDTDFFFGDSQTLMRYVSVEVVEWDVRVRQYGLINIWTSDNINVSVSVSKGLETAGLEKALRIFMP